MPLCIPKEYFGKDGFEDIFQIKDSLTREKKLAEFFDTKTAKDINNRFEKIKLLKRTEVGTRTLINDIKGLNEKKKLEFLKKLATENERKSALLEDLQASGEIKSKEMMDIEKIADDIYKKKHDLDITPEESKRIMELTNVADEASKIAKTKEGLLSPEAAKAKYDLLEAVGELKAKTRQVVGKDGKLKNENKFFGENSKMARETENMSRIEKTGYFLEQNRKYVSSGTFKAMKATWDFSSATIQGVRIFFVSPRLYLKSQKEAFKAFGGKELYKAFKINMLRQRRYDEGIAVGLRMSTEEQLLKLGKSNRFDDYFTVSLQHPRYQIYQSSADSMEKRLGRKLDYTDSNYDSLVETARIKAEASGKRFVMPKRDSQLLKEAADDANKMTGTTNLGKAEILSPLLNEGFFAARYGLSDIRMFTDLVDPRMSATGRIRAVKRLGQSMGYMMVGYYALAQMYPDSTETDPTAANFMRFHIGDKWYGIKMPGEWLFKLAAKTVLQREKNKKGETTEFDSEAYSGKTTATVAARTLRSKLAPIPAMITDFATGKDYMGRKATLPREAINLAAPITTGNILERVYKDIFEGEDKTLMEHLLNSMTDLGGITSYED